MQSSPAIEALADAVDAAGLIPARQRRRRPRLRRRRLGLRRRRRSASLLRPRVGLRAARQLRAAARLRRRRARRARPLRQAPDRPPRRAAGARRGQRPGRAPARRATRRPSACATGSAASGSRPATPAPTSPRPSSTGSPPPRARGRCSACAPRSGSVVRPLHSISREETRAVAEEAGLPFVDDPSNETPRFARNRIRAEVLPVLAEIGPRSSATSPPPTPSCTRRPSCSPRVVAEALERAGAGAGATAIAADGAAARCGRACGAWPCASSPSGAAGRAGPAQPRARRRGSRASPPTRGRRGRARRRASSAICEAGRGPLRAPARTPLARAGPDERPRARPGSATGSCAPSSAAAPVDPGGPDLATLDADALGDEVEIRAWRDGDRMRPLGLGGSKSLQDLFTDRGVPRSERVADPGRHRRRPGRLGRRGRGRRRASGSAAGDRPASR